MKNFLLKTLSNLLVSISLLVIIFLSGVSVFSGKFPPTPSLVKEAINHLIKSKENYTSMLSKSEKYLKNQIIEKENTNVEEPTFDSADLEELNGNLKQLKTQLIRIEQQNTQILKLLNK